MHEALSRGLFLVKECVDVVRLANDYDIYDPATGEIIMECREDHLGPIRTLLRATRFKRMTPFDIQARTRTGAQIVRITRGISIVLSRVSVRDENDELIGGFQQKFRLIGGAFDVLDVNDRPVCTLKGKWTGWETTGQAFSSTTQSILLLRARRLTHGYSASELEERLY